MIPQSKMITFTNLLLIIFIVMTTACHQEKNTTHDTTKKEVTDTDFYIGTYTRTEGHVDGKATGIYQVQVEMATGKISNKKTLATLTNPSFISLSPNKKYLYAVSELAHEDEPTGFIYAYRIGKDSLDFINRLPTDGQAPCHVSIDATGKFAFVANYVGGVAKMYHIGDRGALTATDKIQVVGKSVHPQQDSPHLHSVIISPDNTLALVPDKGTDKIWIFTIDSDNGQLVPFQQPFLKIQDGAGPRHLVWSAKGAFCYVINELDNTANVIQYNKEKKTFTSIQTISTLPADFQGENYCADIQLHPSGQFLYGSNRGHNSIAMYQVDVQTGKLSFLGTASTKGEYPRNFRIGPKGNFLFVANQNTSNITTYEIDLKTGSLQFTGLDFAIETPVCIEF